jgi:hypothetical protein
MRISASFHHASRRDKPSSTVALAGTAVFGSLEEAADAWQQGKGDTAKGACPELVTQYAQLDCLVHCEVSPDGIFRGGEPRAFTGNLFRAGRRTHDIAETIARQGQQWPENHNLYRDRSAEIEAAAKAFGIWYARRHDSKPHQDAVRWLAADWLQGTLPGCGNAVSPHRVKNLLAYMNTAHAAGPLLSLRSERRIGHSCPVVPVDGAHFRGQRHDRGSHDQKMGCSRR